MAQSNQILEGHTRGIPYQNNLSHFELQLLSRISLFTKLMMSQKDSIVNTINLTVHKTIWNLESGAS